MLKLFDKAETLARVLDTVIDVRDKKDDEMVFIICSQKTADVLELKSYDWTTNLKGRSNNKMITIRQLFSEDIPLGSIHIS